MLLSNMVCPFDRSMFLFLFSFQDSSLVRVFVGLSERMQWSVGMQKERKKELHALAG